MTRIIKKLANQRGSALLATLMVVVGLTLLGLGFVAISETESAISVNERNYTQTLNVAEAGARVVVELFQDPDWGSSRELLPVNNTVFKNDRYIDSDGDPLTALENVGEYKSTAGSLLFNRPFKPAPVDRFYGSEDYPDVIIDRSTSTGRTYLDNFNAILFADNDHGGQVTEIKVYAPPIIGGTINAQNCWDGGVRYGLATIAVTAQKKNTAGALLGQRQVKMVISEWPFPGPQGPIQSNANISTGGNLSVHWGKMTARLNLDVNRVVNALPWFDAYERVHFEHGYDSSDEWVASTPLLTVGKIIHPTPAAIAATPTLKQFAYQVTTAGTTGAAEPVWLNGAGGTLNDGTVTFTEIVAPAHKNSATDLYARYDWLYELMGKDFEDPWFEARARGDITDVTGVDFHPFKYNAPAQDELANGVAGWSSWFQMQDQSVRPDQFEVIFPRMDYDFWKEIAVTGHGTEGVYYLTWSSADLFSDGVTTKSFAKWTNVQNKGKPGFYFFDTKNKLNPQGTGAPGVLTPAFQVNSADDGSDYHAQGFFYLNAVDFGSKGISPPVAKLNSPGEPYRDVGYRRVEETGINKGKFAWDGATYPNSYDIKGANNGVWDWQDLPWSDGGTTPNGEFDVFVASKTVDRPGGGSYTGYFPVPYRPGCVPGNNGTASVDCSEPHEPYLNYVYGNKAWLKGTTVTPFKVAWEDPATETRWPKLVDASGNLTPATCLSTSTARECTSNRYDRDGPIVIDLAPMMEGVLYQEGNFDNTTGNAVYFGSLLIQGNVGKAGTAEVWFDEKLVKGEWPPKTFKFPRVFVSAVRTDE